MKNVKYFRKFIFHRIVFSVLALALQLFILIAAIIEFRNYFTLFYGSNIVLSLIVVLIIINNKTNPAYKIGWIIPVLIFPIFGGLFYIFFGGNKLSKRTKNKMSLIEYKTVESFSPNSQIIDEIALQNENAANQARYIHNYSFYPVYYNSYSEYLPTGELKFEKLKEELLKAEHYIFLEYFIVAEGEMWNSILDILVEKVRQGVDVRVIYDDFGCLITLPYRYDKKLEKLGIKCRIFNPLVPILSSKLNNRDHRKIAVIDGKVGFTGGINLADEYINKIERFGHWKDTAIMIKGEAVWSLSVMFLSMWDYLSGINEDFSRFKIESDIKQQKNSDGYIQPFADSPLDGEPVGETVYLNLIYKAKRYIYITTPYLIINNEMLTALTSAAKAGVDVRIITPHIADKWYVHAVTRSNYKVLVESGVKIYEYAPGFIHAKTLVADDEYGIVGTINMDYRSLYLHFECGVWMYKTTSILDLKEDFYEITRMCKHITLEEIRSMKWYNKMIGSVLRVFAPLM